MIPNEKPCACTEGAVLVEVLGLYDGGLFYECFACRAAWHRWPEGDYRHAQAERHLANRSDREPR